MVILPGSNNLCSTYLQDRFRHEILKHGGVRLVAMHMPVPLELFSIWPTPGGVRWEGHDESKFEVIRILQHLRWSIEFSKFMAKLEGGLKTWENE
jgi:hypothetical protein